MHKKKVNFRELIDTYQSNCDRIQEILDVCQKENRERNEEENKEFSALSRDNQMLQMRMQIATAEHLREHPDAMNDAVKILRENAKNHQKTEIIMVRDMMMVSDIAKGNLVPLNIQDILEPLQEGFILDKVGLPMPTGLSGDFVWPMYEMVEAEIAGEGAALSDRKIPFSKMQANPDRVGIAIPVTNQSLEQSDGVLEMIIRKIMPMAIRLLLNKVMFSTTKVNKATNLVGPFVGMKDSAVALSKVPTFEELNSKMKAAVLATGIDGDMMCWVMSKSLEAILEGTPVNEKGIFIPMVQNHMLCGLPVYTTNQICDRTITYKKYTGSAWNNYTLTDGDEAKIKATYTSASDVPARGTEGDIVRIIDVTEYIGLGDWRYQPLGQFGTIRFIVDPYSKARQDSVDFVLNTGFATKTLRQEAFKLGKVAKA